MTLSELENSDKDFLTAAEVAKVIKADPHAIRLAAHERPDLLGFPVVVIGNRVRIPRMALISYCYGLTTAKEEAQA